MSKPAIIPDKTTAGIAVDPRTLQRVVPESRRPDGTVRKEIKIRPGFTPQEDVKRFRGTRQSQMDANALPKGHIIGWTPPPSSTAKPGASGAAGASATGAGGGSAAKSKAAKKNEKRKEKRAQKRDEAAANPSDPVRDDWEDDDDEQDASKSNTPGKTAASSAAATTNAGENTDKDKANSLGSQDKDVSNLTDKIEKLAV